MHYGNITFTTIGLGFLVGLALGASACRGTDPNTRHCAQQDGDETCAEKFGSERPYCAMCGDAAFENDGCVADEPADLECYSPCGGMQSYDENSSCVEVGEGDGDGDGDGDGVGDGDGDGDGESAACSGPGDCTDPTPFCDPDSGECVGCDGLPDDACAGLSADTPVCANGTCVQCDADNDAACKDEKPICKVETNTCVGCTEHEHCPEDSACNLDMDSCIEPANIMHVDGSDDVVCAMATGVEAKPYCTLKEALSQSLGAALIFIHAKSSGAAYQEVNTVDDGIIVLFGVPNDKGDRPILLGLPDQPALSVDASGRLSLRNVEISKSDVEGLRVMGKAWIEKSLVIDNDGGGIVVDGGELTVENSFVGGDQDDAFAVNVLSGSATMTYVTLAAGGGTAAALRCDDDTTTVVRNSLLVAETAMPELACMDAQVSDSALEQPVSGNAELGSMNTDWFEDYGEDFHLTVNAPGPINTAAIWRTGDPVTDIDGDDRPVTDGSPDFAGADIFSP